MSSRSNLGLTLVFEKSFCKFLIVKRSSKSFENTVLKNDISKFLIRGGYCFYLKVIFN